MSKLGLCGICRDREAKYKCPKCLVVYCSIVCFKQHQKVLVPASPPVIDDVDLQVESTKTDDIKNTENIMDSQTTEAPSKFQSMLADPQIQGLLREPSLQFHLHTLTSILHDTSVVNDNRENRLAIANMKLCDLRMGGIEENLLIEEFIARILSLA